jgi:hypothetical protein
MSKPSPTLKFVLVGRWLPTALVCIGAIAFTQLAVQQNYRQSANDPQIQMAEDTAAALNHGDRPASLVPTPKLDREHSLAPFIIIVDKQQHILATNADAGSDSALPPSGVFSNANTQGQQRFTWQTEQGVRYATVVTSTSNGYVVAARSLREVEVREDNLSATAGIALLGLLVVTVVATILAR